MKKFTSILMLFLMCFGMAVQAGPTDLPELTTDLNKPKFYTIKNVRKSKFATYDKDNTKMTQQPTPVEASIFFFTGSINNGVATVKIHNVKAAGKLCAETNSWTVEGRDWYIAAKTTTGLSISKNANFGGQESWNDYQGSGQFVDYWTATDDGSIWQIESLTEQIDEAIAEFDSPYVGSLAVNAEGKALFETQRKSIESGNYKAYFEFLTAKAKMETKLPEAGKNYVVVNANPKFYANQHVEKALYAENGKPMWNTLNEKDQKFYWTFASKGNNGYTLKNVKSTSYIKDFGTMSAAENEAAKFTLTALGEFQYNLVKEGGNPLHANNHGEGNGVGSDIVGWPAGLNSASAWYIKEVKLVDVVYNYFLDGKVVRTETKTQFDGDDFILPYVNDGFKATIETQGKVSATNKEVKVVCQENLPFIKTVDQKNPVLFSVRMKNQFLWHADARTEVKATPSQDYIADFSKTDYQWYFMGNAVTGFKIYNVAQGETVAVSKTDNQASFVDASSATSWVLKKSRTNEGQFCFNDGTTNLNEQGHILKYWGDADQGSSCQFYDIAVNLSNHVLNAANALKIVPVGAVGYHDYFNNHDNVTKLNEAIATLNNDKYNVANREALNNMVNAAKATPAVQFDAAKFYRIKNCVRDLAVDNGSHPGKGGFMGDNDKAGDSISCHSKNMADASYIWEFEKDGNNYKIKNLNSGKYIGKTAATHSQYLRQVETAEAGSYTLTDLGNAQYKLTCSNGLGDQKDLHASSPKRNGPGVMNWNSGANSASAWFLIPATELKVALNSPDKTTYWSSLYLPFDVTLTEGLEAYTGKLNGKSLKMTKVAEVPANNGVILKGTKAKYTLNIGNVTVKQLDNSLKGTNVNKEITDKNNFYILGNTTENGVGLYHPNSTTLKANKAYLDATVVAQVLKFDFDGETTGVEGVEVETENAKAVYYDLSGRRVENPAKGVYIKNGKKVYVK